MSEYVRRGQIERLRSVLVRDRCRGKQGGIAFLRGTADIGDARIGYRIFRRLRDALRILPELCHQQETFGEKLYAEGAQRSV